jgi:hypothetical protein
MIFKRFMQPAVEAGADCMVVVAAVPTDVVYPQTEEQEAVEDPAWFPAVRPVPRAPGVEMVRLF